MSSNALHKLPYMRYPWEHVLGMDLGVGFVSSLVKWDVKLQEDLNKKVYKAKAANECHYSIEEEDYESGMVDIHTKLACQKVIHAQSPFGMK